MLLFSLKDFPLIIEPMAEVLELQSGPNSQSLGWTQLYRVPSEDVMRRILSLPTKLVHFFGPSPDFDNNSHLIAYTSEGLLGNLLVFVDKEWSLYEFPEETTGQPVTFPSVRLVFKEERARSAFLHYIDRVISGKINNPTMALVLEQLTEQPRVIDVCSPL